jgi:integrase/recombinase XerD
MTKQEIMEVLYDADFLSAEQASKITKMFLDKIESGTPKEKDNKELIQDFLKAKKVEGCSARTTNYYRYVLNGFFSSVIATASSITTETIRSYINDLLEKHKVTNISADNTRRILSSFFGWLLEEDYIEKNPMKRIHKIKSLKLVKEAYTDEMVENLKEKCGSVRDLAIIELLSSTGMRVGELVRINKADIDFEAKEIIVLGKGGKQRRVYFDTKTKLNMFNYINSRIDSNEALFVSQFKPHNRLKISGVEIMLRKLGLKACVKDVHPHRFRRTLATKAIDKGMPVEQVQILLGHAKIDTTLSYAIVDQNNVRNSYHRYLE